MAQGFHGSEAIDLASARIEDGNFCFDFTCPRCGHRQTVRLTAKELAVDGKRVNCPNAAVCGEQNMFWFLNSVDWGDGSYQDSCDVPLRLNA